MKSLAAHNCHDVAACTVTADLCNTAWSCQPDRSGKAATLMMVDVVQGRW